LKRVPPNSPAARAGLVKGDVITYCDGRKIFTSEDLEQVVNKLKSGQKVSVTISR
jgi:S1-C subfamily serine protease